jgi:hypothetical protein
MCLKKVATGIGLAIAAPVLLPYYGVKEGIDALSPDPPELPGVVPAPDTPDPAEQFALSIRPQKKQGSGLAFGDFFLPIGDNRG